jgi:hypothetical protein
VTGALAPCTSSESGIRGPVEVSESFQSYLGHLFVDRHINSCFASGHVRGCLIGHPGADLTHSCGDGDVIRATSTRRSRETTFCGPESQLLSHFFFELNFQLQLPSDSVYRNSLRLRTRCLPSTVYRLLLSPFANVEHYTYHFW